MFKTFVSLLYGHASYQQKCFCSRGSRQHRTADVLQNMCYQWITDHFFSIVFHNCQVQYVSALRTLSKVLTTPATVGAATGGT